MSKAPRTAAARPVADHVDPAPHVEMTPDPNTATTDETNPTDASEDARTAPTDAPTHDAETSRGGSVPRTQDAKTLYPDTMTKPNEDAMKAAEGDGAPVADPQPADSDAPVAGAEGNGSFKTTGPFVLMDPFTAKHFKETEATDAPRTQWVQDQLDAKRLVEA